MDSDGHEYHVKDRRTGKDGLKILLSWIGVFGWAVFSASLVVLDHARPDDPNFSPPRHFYDQAGVPYVPPRDYWDQELLFVGFILLIAGFAFSLTGLLLNSLRLRRKDDRYRAHLIWLGAISAVGMIFYIVKQV